MTAPHNNGKRTVITSARNPQLQQCSLTRLHSACCCWASLAFDAHGGGCAVAPFTVSARADGRYDFDAADSFDERRAAAHAGGALARPGIESSRLWIADHLRLHDDIIGFHPAHDPAWSRLNLAPLSPTIRNGDGGVDPGRRDNKMPPATPAQPGLGPCAYVRNLSMNNTASDGCSVVLLRRRWRPLWSVPRDRWSAGGGFCSPADYRRTRLSVAGGGPFAIEMSESEAEDSAI